MTDLVRWLHEAQFDYDELDDERLRLIAESEVTRKCKEAAAEIERLRDGYEQCRATLKHIAADRDQKEAEVQCLRDRLHPFIDYADGVPAGYGEDEIDRQRAEIDRLRQELNQCLHLDHHNAIVANRNAEIERLRGALVLYLDTIRLIREGKPVPVDFLEKRVREALGE